MTENCTAVWDYNCTEINQSQSSNIFMYIIILLINRWQNIENLNVLHVYMLDLPVYLSMYAFLS